MYSDEEGESEESASTEASPPLGQVTPTPPRPKRVSEVAVLAPTSHLAPTPQALPGKPTTQLPPPMMPSIQPIVKEFLLSRPPHKPAVHEQPFVSSGLGQPSALGASAEGDSPTERASQEGSDISQGGEQSAYKASDEEHRATKPELRDSTDVSLQGAELRFQVLGVVPSGPCWDEFTSAVSHEGGEKPGARSNSGKVVKFYRGLAVRLAGTLQALKTGTRLSAEETGEMRRLLLCRSSAPLEFFVQDWSVWRQDDENFDADS
ncbi:hypothetical protein Efla_005985 [Eimeria flavescens]